MNKRLQNLSLNPLINDSFQIIYGSELKDFNGKHSLKEIGSREKYYRSWQFDFLVSLDNRNLMIHPLDVGVMRFLFDKKYQVAFQIRLVDSNGIISILTANGRIYSRDQKISQLDELLKRKNQELFDLSADLNAFSFVTSHDLREPIRKISYLGNELIEEHNIMDIDHVKDVASKIIRSTKRLTNLLDDIFIFFKISSRSPPRPEKVNVNLIIDDILGRFLSVMEKANFTIEVDIIPEIHAYKEQIIVLFENLISNALKFKSTLRVPTIKIKSQLLKANDIYISSATKARNYLKLSIIDNGIGFDNRYSQKMFEIFQRLHVNTDLSGTGMGLAICKKVMQNHGGVIVADGKEGDGAAFFCYFPLIGRFGLKRIREK